MAAFLDELGRMGPVLPETCELLCKLLFLPVGMFAYVELLPPRTFLATICRKLLIFDLFLCAFKISQKWCNE